MPELPEVETVRADLETLLVGQRVSAVEVTGSRSVRRHSAEELAANLVGRRFVSAGRWGKYLWLGLSDGAALVVHLRMSGQLRRYRPPVPEPVAHTHVRVHLADGGELHFVDPRTFGEMFVVAERDDSGRPAVLAGLGPDPLVDGVDAARLGELASRRRTSLKAFLLDQSVLAGIGNIYADEIAFAARLRPSRRVDTLTRAELARLVVAIGEVLSAAVAARGSTLRDALYRDASGLGGQFQLHHAVYGREGEPCPTCGRAVRRVRIAGRSSHYCAHCQRAS